MSQSVRVIGSLTSPYVRAVRALLIELNVPFELQETFGFGKTTTEQHEAINSNNPLLRVPVLIENGRSLIETRVICTHLLRSHGSPDGFRYTDPMPFEEENTVSVVLGGLDTAVLRFMMLKSDPSLREAQGYFLRLAQRLDSAFGWLDKSVANPDQPLGRSFGLSELLLACALDWMEKRQAYDWQRFSRLAEWRTAADRPSLQRTAFPD